MKILRLKVFLMILVAAATLMSAKVGIAQGVDFQGQQVKTANAIAAEQYTMVLKEIFVDPKVPGRSVYRFNVMGPLNEELAALGEDQYDFDVKIKSTGAEVYAGLEEAGGKSILMDAETGEAYFCDIHLENPEGKELVCSFQMIAFPESIKEMIFKIDGYTGQGDVVWSSPDLLFRTCSLIDSTKCNPIGRDLCVNDESCLTVAGIAPQQMQKPARRPSIDTTGMMMRVPEHADIQEPEQEANQPSAGFDKSTELYDAGAASKLTEGGACTLMSQIPSNAAPYIMWAFALTSVLAIRRKN